MFHTMRHVQLKAFHQVAETGGFSKAAEALRLTQPAVSEQVRKLEEEYGVLLFDRSRKRVELTHAGRQLHEVTRRLFEAEAQAYDLLSERRALTSGTLRIIADSAMHLLHILAAFRERHPGVRVSVRTGNTEQVVQALKAWEADVGVMGDAPGGAGFEVTDLGSTPIVAFVARNSRFSGLGRIGLADLSRLPLVLRERGSKTRQKVEAALAAAGLPCEPSIEAEGREAVREIVAAGAGIGLVSLAEFGHDPRLERVDLSDASLEMSEALVCLTERMAARPVASFLSIARAAAEARKKKGGRHERD